MKKTAETSFYLFKFLGFEIKIDWSCIFLAIFVTWTLAIDFFPRHFPNCSMHTYWLMGLIGAVGLFLSIVCHELCHSIVGRYYGMPFKSIIIFIFGGMAETKEIPPSPKVEFLISFAGPLFSLILGLFFKLLLLFATNNNWPASLNGILFYFGMINIVLGIFNLMPGLPLDGGRILRAILWWWKNDLKWATTVACQGGIGLSFAMIFFGFLLIVQTIVIGGIWIVLLGFFMLNSAKICYKDFIIQESFGNDSIKKYIKTPSISLHSDITVQALADDYFQKYYHKIYPVTEEDGTLLGYVSLDEIKQIPKEKWPLILVRNMMLECSEDILIDGDTKVIDVLHMMRFPRNNRIIVAEHGKLYGTISFQDLMDAIFIKLSLK
jgi:Zn-dependent protease